MCWCNFSTFLSCFSMPAITSLPLCPLPSVLFYLPLLFLSHFPLNLFLSDKLVLKRLFITLLSYVSLPSLVSFGIRRGWVESKVNRSCLNPSRKPSSSPLPKQTLKLVKRLILFSRRGPLQVNAYVAVTDPLTVASLCSPLASLMIDTVQRKNKQSVTNPDYCLWAR